MGIVKSLIERKDGVTRAVRNCTVKTILEMARQQFCPFEVHCNKKDFEILGSCPAGPVLPHGEKVPL